MSDCNCPRCAIIGPGYFKETPSPIKFEDVMNEFKKSKEIENLRSALKVAEEALEFYAYGSVTICSPPGYPQWVAEGGGTDAVGYRACEALAKLKELKS